MGLNYSNEAVQNEYINDMHVKPVISVSAIYKNTRPECPYLHE